MFGYTYCRCGLHMCFGYMRCPFCPSSLLLHWQKIATVLKKSKSWEECERYLQDPNPVIRCGALDGLSKTTSVLKPWPHTVTAALCSMLKDELVCVRLGALHALGEAHSTCSVETQRGLEVAMSPCLNDPCPQVRSAAFAILYHEQA